MKSKKIPEIRFSGFTDEWLQLKFIEILKSSDGIRRGPFGSALKKDLFVESSDYVVYEQKNAIYNNFDTRYNITEEKFKELKNFQLVAGDFILSGAGTIGRISRVPKNTKPGVFNQALIRFRINEAFTDSEYFLQWIRSEKMQKEITGANPGSAITNLVPMSEVKNWDIVIPTVDEQAKIGVFFKKLDDIIAIQLQELNTLKQTKQGFLQKMFPKEGESVPELRFPGFTGEWERVKISELFKVTRGQVLASNKTSVIKTIDSPYPVYSSQTKNNGLMGFYKDYLFESAITWTTDGANAGTVNYREGKFYSTNVNGVLLSDEGYANKAVAEALNRVAWKYVSKVGNPKLMNNIMSDIVINLSLNIEEQEKISEFFERLDYLIDIKQQELDALKQTKQAFLQKMFV